MTIIDRIDCAATRAQLIAMAAVQEGTIAAAGFAGLLIVILKSDTVRAALESIIQEALNTR